MDTPCTTVASATASPRSPWLARKVQPSLYSGGHLVGRELPPAGQLTWLRIDDKRAMIGQTVDFIYGLDMKVTIMTTHDLLSYDPKASR